MSKIVAIPRDLYYHEVAYVRGLEGALVEARRQLILLGGDGREHNDCDAIQAAVLNVIDAALPRRPQEREGAGA